MTSRIVVRLTPKCFASAGSEGSRSPGSALRSRSSSCARTFVVFVWDGGMEGCRFAAAGGAVELRPSGTNLPQGPTTIMLEADNVDDCSWQKKPGDMFMNISRIARMGSHCSILDRIKT